MIGKIYIFKATDRNQLHFAHKSKAQKRNEADITGLKNNQTPSTYQATPHLSKNK